MNSRLLYFFLFFSFLSKAQVCFNMGFEGSAPGVYSGPSNSLSVWGWTVSSRQVTSCSPSNPWLGGSSEFSLVSTPLIVPVIGTLPHSPLGGTVVATLNNWMAPNSMATRLARGIPVIQNNAIFTFAYAGMWDNSAHLCCEHPKFRVEIKDYSTGNLINCSSMDLSAGSCSTGATYTITNGIAWTNWQVKNIDLTPYIGTAVYIEIINQDCIWGGHPSAVYFDARCGDGSDLLSCNCSQVNPASEVSFCAGSTNAQIQAPPGYQSYLWTAPSGYTIAPTQATLSTLTFPNPMVGQVFSVQVNNGICQNTLQYTLSHTTVNIAGLGISAPCQNMASGSASILASGSNIGYNYIWTNSSNSVISTGSVVSNIPQGNYSVQISAPGCGTTALTVTVPIAPTQAFPEIKYFCTGQPAYFSANSGSNIQWYAGNAAISSTLGGTAPGYTLSNPVNGMIIRLASTNTQGCRDSVIYTLLSTSPGSVHALASLVCPGASNGTAVITLSSAVKAPSGNNAYAVNSTGTLSPPYSSTLSGSSLNSYSVSNLSAGGVYTVTAFDGLCYYGNSFTVFSHPPFDFTLSPGGTNTVCSGNFLPAAVNFSPTPGGTYNYLWQPNVFLSGNNATLPNTIITPTIAPGLLTTIVYSVTATPTLINCPLTKTFSLTVVNLLTPTIPAIPSLCSADPTLQINVSPAGGIFIGNSAISQQAVLDPSGAGTGINTFTYAMVAGTCVAASSSSFMVVATPTLSVSGNLFVCSPGSTTLTAAGAGTYSWSNGSGSAGIVLSPAVSTTLSVKGNNGACADSTSILIQVAPETSLSVSGNQAICAGTTATLLAIGATNYSWNNGSGSNSIIVNPPQTTSYSVTGWNSSFCSDSVAVILNVTPVPVLNVPGNFNICAGESALLVADGAHTYTWNNGASGAIIGVTPTLTTVYTVTGTNMPAGCTSSLGLTMHVDACTGLEKISEMAHVKVFPNPVSEELIIISDESALLTIHNAIGMCIMNKPISNGKSIVNTDGWSCGIYFVQVTGNNGNKVFRVVKRD